MTIRLRKVHWAGALMALSLLTTACGSYDSYGSYGSGGEGVVNVDKATTDAMQTAEVYPTSADAPEAMIEPVKVVWWHSLDGELGKAAKQLVANFNAWHPAIRVEAIYQGTCDESLSTLKALTGSESRPSLMQACDIGSEFMIDLGMVTPVQRFMDAEGYDVSALEPNIRHSYILDGTQYGMPFYTSGPILYYNKTLFMDAGLNAVAPPGLGREAEEARSAFINGQAAMTLDSSASLRGIVDGVGGKFEVGAAFVPQSGDEKEGVGALDGASLWVMNHKPEAEQQAAWAFIKYLVEPKTQAEWYIQTGCFPITAKAYDKPSVQAMMAKYPQLQTAIDQLRQRNSNAAAKGAIASAWAPSEAPRRAETAGEEAISVRMAFAGGDDNAETMRDGGGDLQATAAKSE
ncbi:extracellular solute-binding protein [Paenibacillus xanthanilyticus]|uniref:Extracellular solute-binding protein n=1 Tax=Paenibacillus xanthanilyticus TaxID=1783531 RepID=A0ABV8JXQ9_9BACL